VKGICWEQRKNEKKILLPLPPPPPPKKEMNISQEQTFMMKKSLKNKFVRREFMV
jgi:hypothetical protein